MGEPMKLPTPAPLTTGPCPWMPDSWQTPAKDGACQLDARKIEDGDDSNQSTSCGASEVDSPTLTPRSSIASIASVALQLASSMEESAKALSMSKFSFFQRASLILPAISECAQHLGITQSVESIEQLQRQVAEHPASLKPNKTNMTAVEYTRLRSNMATLQVQELMEMLKSEEAPTSVQLSIETLCYEMEYEFAKLQKQNQGSNKKQGSGRKQASRKR